MRLPPASALFGAFSTDLLIAFRNVFRHRRRSLTGISSVAFGVVALMLAAGFIEWIYWAMREDTIRSRLGHMQIVRAGYLEDGQADPFRFLLPANSPERTAIEALPEVETLAPRLAFSGLISLGETTLSFIGEGIDAEREGRLATQTDIRAGQALAAGDQNSVMLGEGLAANLGAKVGDQVIIVANTKSGGINAVEARVKGIFATISKPFDDAALQLELSTAQSLLRVQGAHLWVLCLKETQRTDEVLTQVREILGPTKLEVTPWYEMADFYNKTVSLFSKQVGVMKLIIAIIIVLSISNTLTMSVLERTSEIGTSLALGTRRVQILRQFMGEGLALGVIGGTVGLIVGALLALVVSAIGIPMPPPPGMAHGFTGEVLVTPRLAFDASLLAVTTTLLASIYPAWRASRLEIVDALRHSK
jgi:putative ABC transport system permease protein